MSTPKNWNQPQNLGDWMRQQEKRAAHSERRPQIQHASDLMGPGIAPRAVEIRDWNGEETAFNGFFYSAPGSINSPDDNEWWIGESIAESDGYGTHVVRNHHSAAPIVIYQRRFGPNGDGRTFGPWTLITTGGGGGGAPTGPAGGDLTGTYPNPTVAALAITDAKVAAANKDGASGVPSMRTLGTGAGQAAPGTHSHVIADLPVATSGTSSSTQVVRADDSRLSNSRTPTSHTHTFTDLSGGVLAGPLPIAEQATPSTPASGTGYIYFKTDSGAYAMGDNGTEVRLTPITQTRHANADFELWGSGDGRTPPGTTTAFPTAWTAFWSGGTAEFYQDVTDYITGASSLRAVKPVGVNLTVETAGTSTFDVQPGDIVTIGFWGKVSTTGTWSPTLLTAASGTPEFFAGGTTQTARIVTMGTIWAYYEVSMTVPATHTRARVSFGANTGSGSTVTFWLDGTSSSVRTPDPVDVSPTARRSLSANQSITNNAFNDVLWLVSDDLVDIVYSAGTFTINRPGLYQINCAVGFDPHATGRRILRVLQNGTEKTRIEQAPGNATGSSYGLKITDTLRCTTNDTLVFSVFQTSGAALNLIGTAGVNNVSVTWLGY